MFLSFYNYNFYFIYFISRFSVMAGGKTRNRGFIPSPDKNKKLTTHEYSTRYPVRTVAVAGYQVCAADSSVSARWWFPSLRSIYWLLKNPSYKFLEIRDVFRGESRRCPQRIIFLYAENGTKKRTMKRRA